MALETEVQGQARTDTSSDEDPLPSLHTTLLCPHKAEELDLVSSSFFRTLIPSVWECLNHLWYNRIYASFKMTEVDLCMKVDKPPRHTAE